MPRTAGHPDVVIGLLDEPVAALPPHSTTPGTVLAVPPVGRDDGVSMDVGMDIGMDEDSAAVRHGTAVAGVLAARRSTGAPSLCPDCPLRMRPVFTDGAPWASAGELALGIEECRALGARLNNTSAGFTAHAAPSADLEQALDLVGRDGVIVVAASGNQGLVGGSPLTSHPAVLPVAPCDLAGRPPPEANVSLSIGRRGVLAPGIPLPTLRTRWQAAALRGEQPFRGRDHRRSRAGLVVGPGHSGHPPARGGPKRDARPARRIVPPPRSARGLAEEVT